MSPLGDIAAAAVVVGALLKHFADPKKKKPKQ